jgi:hypothetical protein
MARTAVRSEPARERAGMEEFRARLEAAARRLVAWHPESTHGSITMLGPDGRQYTAYAKDEGPGYMSVWIREGGGVEPDTSERDRLVVAMEEVEAQRGKRKRQQKEPDPRIWRTP